MASQSEVTFNATGGTTYYIQVDGYDGSATGSITLNVADVPPANDDFANAEVIDASALPATVSGTSVGATGETGEPGGQGALNTVWWQVTPAADGTLIVDTSGSDFDTYLSVFTGSPVDNLALVAENDDGGVGLTSAVTISATGGTTYYIQVDGFSTATGNITLNVADPSLPANDDFANAEVIDTSALPATVSGTSVGATGETGEPVSSGTLNTVWWQVTPAADATLRIDTFGSNFDTALSVFTGAPVNNLTLVDTNDDADSGGRQSEVTFSATGGTTYYIQVDGYE